MLALPLLQDPWARWRDRLPTALETAVVLLLALQAARLLWLALTPTGPVGEHEGRATRPSAASSFGRSDVFFRQTTNDSTTQRNTEALGYSLFGVRAGTGGSAGSAILAGSDGRQAAYRVGDVIAPGLVLEAVAPDHAVLGTGGNRHRIDMPDLAAASSSAPPATSSGALPTSMPSPAAAAIDPQQLLAQAGLRPRSEGGYTVIPRGDGAVLRQAGLQSGDVLLSVNGQSLTPERLGELNEELKGQSQVSITFQRDGQTQTVTLPASPP